YSDDALPTICGSRPRAGSCSANASSFATPRPADRSSCSPWTTLGRSLVFGYEELEAAARKALASPSTTLWSLVSDQSALDQAQFVDAVSGRLRQSHFMVLIIGDGIQDGVESLTSYLQLHAGLHVGLALVDLSIWRDGDGRLLVMPRIPLHTVLVERGVVTVGPFGEVKVQPPDKAPSQPRASSQQGNSLRPVRNVRG